MPRRARHQNRHPLSLATIPTVFWLRTCWLVYPSTNAGRTPSNPLNCMKSRLKNGYWCFVGYRYQKTSGQGKILVRDEPIASIIQEALKSYASGRFPLQVEVKRFLESFPNYPRDRKGKARNQRVTDLPIKLLPQMHSRPQQRGGGFHPRVAWRFTPHSNADQAGIGRQKPSIFPSSGLIRRPVIAQTL